jgi:hypothetical protein
MKCVYNAADMLEAHVLVGLLQQHKISGFIEGEYLTGGMGDLAAQNYVRVMVNNDDYAKAREVALEYDHHANEAENVPLPEPIFRHWHWFALAIAGIIAAELIRFL